MQLSLFVHRDRMRMKCTCRLCFIKHDTSSSLQYITLSHLCSDEAFKVRGAELRTGVHGCVCVIFNLSISVTHTHTGSNIVLLMAVVFLQWIFRLLMVLVISQSVCVMFYYTRDTHSSRWARTLNTWRLARIWIFLSARMDFFHENWNLIIICFWRNKSKTLNKKKKNEWI